MPPSSLRCSLPRARAIRIVGEDSLTWLQGQITQDVKGLAPGQAVSSAMASPTGQIEAILRVAVVESEVIVVTEAPDALMRRIEELVIMEDVSAEVLDDEVWVAQGPELGGLEARFEEGSWWIPSVRLGTPSWEVIGAASKLESLPQIPEEDLMALQAAAGNPLWGVDTTDKTLVSELGPRFLSEHVSFEKGCYTGQEIIHRIHARGRTNRTWMNLRFEGEAAPGELIGAGGEPVGEALFVAQTPDLGWIGTAMVRAASAEPGSFITRNGVKGKVVEPGSADRF